MREVENGYVALCCGSPDRILLTAAKKWDSFLVNMNMLKDRHWYASVQLMPGKILLEQSGSVQHVDLRKYQIE